MTDTAIQVTNLGKACRQNPNRWSRLAEWTLPGHKPRHQLKWVLRDINFTVNPGESVGIIGVNGAGSVQTINQSHHLRFDFNQLF